MRLAPVALALTLPLAARSSAYAQPRPTSGPLHAFLVTQLRLGTTQDLGAEPGSPVLELRRLRLGLRASALGGALTGLVVVNANPLALELLDAWGEVALGRGHRLRVGLAKVSSTTYRMGAFSDLVFVDWALVTRPFGTERQLGAELHNQRSGQSWEYALGLWHGSTARAAHGRGLADVYAEPVANLSDLRVGHGYDPPHPEVSGRLLWRGPAGPPRRLHVTAGLNAQYDLRPVEARDIRLLVAPEIALARGPLHLEITAWLGLAEGTTRPGVGAVTGLLAEVHAELSPRVTLGLRYAQVDVSEALRDDARARAQRLSQQGPNDTREALTRRYALAGTLSTEHEIGIALRVDVLPPFVRWQTDLGWIQRHGDPSPHDEIRGRTQLQLAL